MQKNWKRPLIRLAAKLGLVERSAAKESDMYGRLLRWICAGTGIVDWCAGADDIAATMALWEKELDDTLGFQEFKRTRPDGKVAKWYLGGVRSLELPFLIEDISHRDIRVPPASADTHPNGALGIAGLIRPVDNTECLQAQYDRLGLSALPVTFVARDKPDWKIILQISHPGTQDYGLDRRQTHGALITMVGERTE